MMEVLFYHLEGTDVFSVLPSLLEKCSRRGWRSVVVTGAGLEALDAHLWTYKDDSFLPHACISAKTTSKEMLLGEPVVLTTDIDFSTKEYWQEKSPPEVLFLIEEAMGNMEELASFRRSIVIFDGANASALDGARNTYKAAQSAGHEVTYWRRSAQGAWRQQGA